jgi:hypothetical protein
MRASVASAGSSATANVAGVSITLESGDTGAIIKGNTDSLKLIANDTLTVTGTGETYNVAAGIGQSEIKVGTGTNTGTLDIGSNFNKEDLWFQQAGNNLQVDLMGSSDKLTIDNWFLERAKRRCNRSIRVMA